MKAIKAAAAVMNQTPLDWENNRDNILETVEEGRRRGVSLLCLPELCITGYGCEDAFSSPGVHAMAWDLLREIVPRTKGMIVALGLPLMIRKAVVNAVCLAVDGRILGFVPKQHLAGEGLHYEPRWFKEWPGGVRTMETLGGETFPVGDYLFDVGGVRIGLEICEDAWVANRPGGLLAEKGVDLILNPSASHFSFGKHEIRKRFVLEGSRAFGVGYIYSNLLGNESGRVIYDGGALIASGGRLLASGPRFSFSDWVLTDALIDVELNRTHQSRTASFHPRFDLDPSECISCDFEWPQYQSVSVQRMEVAAEPFDSTREEEFTRAISLGLFDYLRKSHSSGFVVSISGGADSAAVSCLTALMVELGLQELGSREFYSKLGYIKALSDCPDATGAIGRLLTCVYQSTRNSSVITLEAARGVAEAIGARFLVLDVDSLFSEYVERISRVIGRPIDWSTDDVVLQNIQARVRGPGAWMLANLDNALLLATSNRSEAAVGYATMDGDTCGGLSPIAGIDKAFIRRWLKWLETCGPKGLHPIPALAAVNVQAPTAELRPAAAGQTDEEDLMPYDVLDAIERMAILDKRTPCEVYDLLGDRFPDYDRSRLATWIERFFRLWCRNQWKRERYAPSFHVDDENLDPKTWCRFPILSGGFESELRELRRMVDGDS